MKRTLLVLAAVSRLCIAGEAATKPTHIIRLEHNDASLAPAIAFGSKGELYVAYRTQGPQHQSSVVTVGAFDSNTGRELRKAQIKAPTVQLPQAPSIFQVSPDGNLLLYVETPSVIGRNRATYLAVVDAVSLQLISSTDLVSLALSNSRVFGFRADSQAVVLGSSVQRIGPNNQPVTQSVRVVELKAHDLKQIVHDQSIANPYGGYGYTIDAAGSLWFSKDPFIAKSFSEYNPKGGTAAGEISSGSDYGFAAVIFLPGSIVGFTHEASHDATFTQVMRFEPGKAEPAQIERVTGCGFKQVTVSPDQLFAAGICDEQSQAEPSFGALTVCNAVILQTRTLKVLATIPLSKGTTWHSVAVWHGNERVLAATSDRSEMKIFLLREPK